MQIRMHVQVIFPEVALDQQLVLLRVAAAHDQEVVAGHKPAELLEPERLAQRHRGHHRLHLRRRSASRAADPMPMAGLRSR